MEGNGEFPKENKYVSLRTRRTQVTEIARPEQEDRGKEAEESLSYKHGCPWVRWWTLFTETLEAVLHTLQSLEKEDTVACGLLTKMHKPKFIGCIYIFQHVLPTLNQLSKTFQKGSVNFSYNGPAVEHAKQKLQTISSDALPVKQLQEDFKPGGRLSRIDLAPTEHHFVEMDRLLKKYVTSLITNIDNRFKASIPVLKAFSIFDVMAIPSIRSLGFKE